MRFLWKFNGIPIDTQSDRRVSVDVSKDKESSVLVIKNILAKDAGKYSCGVSNSVGSDEGVTELRVKGLSFACLLIVESLY